ncbi:hypothetical protein [Bdellovibrio sp. NC01]|uniref:hypothetical protein n=1 Tax=Bdellovibrio sp. NC01 TaxID=2220073 RepID=UPI001157CFB2|nr:hypothetical protein [Bdellovibrio sp. NC01]QDK37870.1 hypothetical protein DOE51_09875 [Bdellovibrio sp. NC01]
MAKIVKKKPAAKAAAKPVKKAPAKAAAKPAPAKKAAPKTVVKKKVEAKAPAKAAASKKPELKKKVEAKAKPVAKAEAKTPAAKPAAKEVKAEAKETAKKAPAKAAAPQPAAAKEAPKKDAKAPKKGKAAKGKEKEESDLDDDFIADDDMMGDEIGEYEEELKAVEESEEDVDLVEEWTGEEKAKSDEEIILTDAEGRRYCRARDCDQIAVVDAYCRFHYLMFWKKIQVRKKILQDGKLERYVEELTSRYPDKFLEMIRRDLRTEKDFLAAIQELEIDESVGENEFEEDTSAYIEEVRGMGDSGGGVEEDEY